MMEDQVEARSFQLKALLNQSSSMLTVKTHKTVSHSSEIRELLKINHLIMKISKEDNLLRNLKI